MCIVWQVKVRKEKLNVGICNTGKTILPKKTPTRLIKKNIKYPTKKLLSLFHLYAKEYRQYQQLLGGLIDMIGALQYHHNNHSKFEAKLIAYYKPIFEIGFYDPQRKDPEYSAKLANALNSQSEVNLRAYPKIK